MLPEDAFEEARGRTSSIVKAARGIFDLARTAVGSNALSRPKGFMAFGVLIGASLPLYGVVLLGLEHAPGGGAHRHRAAIGLAAGRVAPHQFGRGLCHRVFPVDRSGSAHLQLD